MPTYSGGLTSKQETLGRVAEGTQRIMDRLGDGTLGGQGVLLQQEQLRNA